MIYYIEIFFAVFILSTFFAIGGVGSAIALVPFLNFMSVPLNVAKMVGLLVNTISTITASWLNFKKKIVDFNFAIPLIISGLIFSPIGAHSSQFIDEKTVKIILIIFLIISSLLLLFYKKTPTHNKYKKQWILYIVSGVIAFISGLLGIGGGSFLMPILIFLGYDTKKIAIVLSFIIPFSTFPAFLSYISFIKINWALLEIAFFASILGGFTGNKIMHLKLQPHHIKKIIGVFLVILAIKMCFDVF